MSKYPISLLQSYEIIEQMAAEIARLRADLGLLRPVCSADSGGMVEGVLCPTCKGNGFLTG